MEAFVANENKEIFKKHGFEIQNPPELMAKRTILIKGIDTYFTGLDENELKELIYRNHPAWKINKIIKIPGNSSC